MNLKEQVIEKCEVGKSDFESPVFLEDLFLTTCCRSPVAGSAHLKLMVHTRAVKAQALLTRLSQDKLASFVAAPLASLLGW